MRHPREKRGPALGPRFRGDDAATLTWHEGIAAPALGSGALMTGSTCFGPGIHCGAAANSVTCT